MACPREALFPTLCVWHLAQKRKVRHYILANAAVLLNEAATVVVAIPWAPVSILGGTDRGEERCYLLLPLPSSHWESLSGMGF